MNFSRFLDIQSWWEVPSIAYFCSLFRTAFNLLDFDIEELEEALLTDGTEECASSLLTELIVRLLNGCLGNNDISAFNFQMYLRRLFRQKCQETGRCNPFNTDIDFQFLPLRTKVEILYALCDFRLYAEDVFDLFKNLEAESLRVEPLGWDDNGSAYWYFYGTRLYREDIVRKPRAKSKKKKKEGKKRGWFYGDDWLDDEDTERVWQVVCFTEDDWNHLTEKFSKATSKVEKELHRSLSQNFLPEIPRLFQEKERLQRKRLLELAPRRTSSRVLQKINQKHDDIKAGPYESTHQYSKESPRVARENRARRRNQLRSKSSSSEASDSTPSKSEDMPQEEPRHSNTKDKRSKSSPHKTSHKSEPRPEPVVKTGRKTNNSLAAATGQIVIPDNDEPVNSTRKKLKTSQIFSQTEEDIQTDMYKVLEQLTAHEDAWPFMDPVEEEYAPNYYAVIRRPMELRKMEERLDSGYYTDFSMFKADFKLIVNNCRLYNGQDNEYTTMVDNLQAAFDRLTEKYIHRLSSSDEEIAVEYQLPTPARKHKLKTSESPVLHKRKKRKSHTDTGDEGKSDSIEKKEEEEQDEKRESGAPKEEVPEMKKSKESHKNKHDKGKKKRKGHRRHGKHSKNRKKNSHKSNHESRRHSKKHGKNKDKEGKKSKKKKNKHHDVEPLEVLKRSESQESLESSNRSRSASPLPSIHTPSPSPTELDKSEETVPPLTGSDFLKDKYDQIKERRRHAAKDAWESLFDFKQKSDLQKQNINVPEKEKNQQLRETIEKLKAKNEKYRGTSLFNSLFKPGGSNAHFRTYKSSSKDDDSDFSDDDDDNDDDDEDETIQSIKEKPIIVKKGKKTTAKNEGASEALEEAVKDISKWLDDAPKPSTASTSNANPVPTIPTEEPDAIRLDDESSQGEKSSLARKDLCRKRPSSREPKVVKRREIQRTIERLQPGKSKGNLLTNISNKSTEKTEDVTSLGTSNKARDSNKREECSPKLSLGSVLPTVEFTLGNDHNFNNETYNTEQRKQTTKEAEPVEIKTVETKVDSKPEEKPVIPTKRDAEVETDPPVTIKPSQEKATPNLSAWFKAFGAPKTTNPLTTTKKKVEGLETEDKTMEHTTTEAKTTSPKNTITATTKSDSPNDLNSPIPDGGDSPIPSVTATPRQRKTSTGSSISERSSFSQDLDSPRHLMSHTSPLLRSPASPRTDDFQKITYPIINGSVRAGFYHDTTSVRSSPEKSCSPRDAPQSPYSPYSPHVYVSNSNTGSATPNYFVDHNKSPLPTYGQNAPPYYDTSKASLVNKPPKVHEDYTSLGPDSFQQNPFNGSFSPTPSPYPPSQTNYSQPQISPQPGMSTSQPVQILPDPKTSLFPVKKRTYNEPENPIPPKTLPENKDTIRSSTTKNDYTKSSQSTHSLQTLPSTSVDDIALALSEKSENLKLNSLREKNNTLDFSERLDSENRDNTHISFENEDLTLNDKNEVHIDLTKPFNATKKDNIDMVNMGYMNVEDRKNNTESQDVEFVSREIKPNLTPQQKGYEIEAIAINLGINNQQLPKQLNKPPVSNMTPAHTHEKLHNETSSNQNIPHAHQSTLSQYETGQPISSFSLNDIEVANKKLFAANNNTSSTALDYGNWKMNQVRKPEMLPSDYSANNYSSSNEEKIKMSETLISNTLNYNKNLQHQHFGNYNNVSRSNTQRNHETQQRNHEVQHRNHEVQQRNHEIQQRSHEVQHRNHEVQQRSHEVQQRNHEVQPRSHEVQQRSHEIQHRNHEVHQRNHEVQHRNHEVQQRNHEVQQRNHEVQQRNHEIQQRNHEMQQNLPSELRIPNPRGIHKPDTMNITTSTNDCDTHSKNMDVISKPQKNEKPAQNHTIVSSLPYKTSYSTHSALPIETLRNLPNIPQMLERYTNDERYLSSFANSSNSLYHDKTFQMAQMFNKNITSEAHHPPSTSVSIYSQPSIASMSKDNNTYKNSVSIASTQLDSKKNKRKRTSDTKQLTGQTYHTSTSNNDVLTSVKSSMIPASPFNFGTSTNMALSGMYGENGAFTIEDFRNSTNQLMAANYMAAAVAHQQRNNEVNADKLVKPAHQNSNHQSTSSFPFIGHSQVRAGYPFVGAEPSSPLYQQYLQRYQEELQRQTGAQIMGLYPSAYPTPLGVRQPYDSINRPSWL